MIFLLSVFIRKPAVRHWDIFGSHSGRDENKIEAVGFTPVKMGQGVTFEEAECTFLCKKLYQHQFSREDLAPEIQEYYAAKPEVYPDFKGGWQPHYVFVGEIIDVRKKEENHVE